MSRFQILTIISCISGLGVTLGYLFFGLRFSYGADYYLILSWLHEYMKTGIFYPENTLFCNFPLAIIAYGPFGWFLTPKAAVVLKGIQTAVLMIFCLHLITRTWPGLIKRSPTARFTLVILCFSVLVLQLVYLNIYVETSCCLLLSHYFLLESGTQRVKRRDTNFLV